MSAPTKPPGVRRVPSQERSRRRFEAILDASAFLFSERGYAAVSVEAIAERAGIPIGSVYQFFRDKEALFASVVDRCNQRTEAAFDLLVRAADADPPPSWELVLDSVIDGFALLSESDPSFRAVNRNLQFMGGDSAHRDELVYQRIAIRTAQLLARYAPSLPAARRRLVATLLVDVVTGVLAIASRREDRVLHRQLVELKTLMRVYMRHTLAVEAAAAPPKKRRVRRARA